MDEQRDQQSFAEASPARTLATPESGRGSRARNRASGRSSRASFAIFDPPLVFVENVAALTARGLDRVLGDLAALGFDAEWDVLEAADVGAPHRRARMFILAHAECDVVRDESGGGGGEGRAGADESGHDGAPGDVADADGRRREARAILDVSARALPQLGGWWAVEPDVGRVANGFPARVDRLRCLGNAVVAQQAAEAWRTLAKRVVEVEPYRG
jgi:DNA (cytosine-5)-methyltransferase 1